MVHHLMDMEPAYDDRPSVVSGAQLARLPELARRFPGKLIGFVAFDPFRRAEALAGVRSALASGAALGVKFYPPSGYRAAGNGDWPGKPGWWKFALRDQWSSRYSGWKGSGLDRVNRELFAYCALHDIPILAHCTPDGFEAAEGYGRMADPDFWAQVLGEFPKLRLALAHAGGGDSWFPTGPGTAGTDSISAPGTSRRGSRTSSSISPTATKCSIRGSSPHCAAASRCVFPPWYRHLDDHARTSAGLPSLKLRG